MRVLVTGGTGFVGSHAVAELARAGHGVRLLVRDASKIDTIFGPLGISRLDHVVGDATKRDAVAGALDGCDAVIHAAAVRTLDRRRAGEIAEVNVRAAQVVLGAAAEAGLDPIVHVSSLSALDRAAGSLGPDSPVVRTTDAYAASKARAEEFARDQQARGVPVVIVYPGAVWGPDEVSGFELTLMIERFLQLGFVLASSEGGIPFVDVRDVASMLAAVLEAGRGPRRYMAGGTIVPVAELGRILGEITERRLRILSVPGRLMRASGRVGDVVNRAVDLPFAITTEAMDALTRAVPSDDSRTNEDLGVVFRPVRETIEDGVRFLYARGAITAAQAGRLAHGQ